MSRARTALLPAITAAAALAIAACGAPASTHGQRPAAPLPWAGESAQHLIAAAQGPTRPRSEPVWLTVPALGISAPIMTLGLASDGTMEVPPLFGTPSKAGWYRYSPTPGQPGPSIIAGHIDTYKGPAVFARLAFARPGQRINVRLADGDTAVFAVTSVRQYPKNRFPARTVYGPVSSAGLRLITCGGQFDTAARSYLSSTVVFASLTPASSGRPAAP